jgi:hypothetical protein
MRLDLITIEEPQTLKGQPNHVPGHMEHTNVLDHGMALGARFEPSYGPEAYDKP